MIVRSVHVLERVVQMAPFGVFLWDQALQAPAGRGLVVTLRAEHGGEVIPTVHGPSGVHALPWPVEPGDYVVEIDDPLGRYLPLRFSVTLPQFGLFEPTCVFTGSPPWRWLEAPASPTSDAIACVPLFSAPTRPIRAGMAVVRANIEVASAAGPPRSTVGPASWALVQLLLPARDPVLGLADGHGNITLPFAYPEPVAVQLSPPGAGSTGLTEQVWTLGFQCYFGVASSTPGSTLAVAGPTDAPDLCALVSQDPATALADHHDNSLGEVELHYGREAVLETTPHSSLLLVPSS